MLYVYLLCSRTAGAALLNGYETNRYHCAYDKDDGKEKHIRDAGEKASGLYGAEAWVSMTGRRYEELSAKQGRMEREMLGMAKTQELWRAREEMGTRSWSVEEFVQKWDIIQSMRKNDKAIIGHILRDRIESWKSPRTTRAMNTRRYSLVKWISSGTR